MCMHIVTLREDIPEVNRRYSFIADEMGTGNTQELCLNLPCYTGR